MPGRGAVAGPPRACASSYLLPPLSPLELDNPSFAATLSFFSFSFSFSAACSYLLPLLATPAPLEAASNCFDAGPRTGHDRFPESPELAGASAGAASHRHDGGTSVRRGT